MRRVPIAMVVAAVLLSTPQQVAVAQAATCVRGTPAQKGQAAIPMLAYPWHDLGYSVEFHPGRSGVLGLTYPDQRRIEVYVRDCQSIESVANVFAHEVGHAVDETFNDSVRREEWQRIRGYRAGWYACSGCSDYRFGSGDFAEVFAFLKAAGGRFRSAVAGPPSPEQAVQLERFFYPTPPAPPTPPEPPRGLLDILELIPGLGLPPLRLVA